MTNTNKTFKTFNELAHKANLTIVETKDTRYVTENGLTIFDFGHKIGVSYMPTEDSECMCKISEITDELLAMLYDAISQNRIDMKNQEEQDRIDQLKMTFEEQNAAA